MNDQNPNASPFDPDAFMAETVDAPQGDTEFRRVPEGEYQAMLGDFTSEAISQFEFTYKRGPNAGQQGVMTKVTLPFVITDARLVAELGRDTATVNKEIILDYKDGKLDFGPNRNVDLNRVRDAVGQNKPGPFSLGNLRNTGPVMVKVVHKEIKGKSGTFVRAEVDRVVKLST